MLCTQVVSNKNVLKKMAIERRLLVKVVIKQLKFFGHIRNKKILENLTDHIKDVRRQRATYRTSLCMAVLGDASICKGEKLL